MSSRTSCVTTRVRPLLLGHDALVECSGASRGGRLRIVVTEIVFWESLLSCPDVQISCALFASRSPRLFGDERSIGGDGAGDL